MCTIGTAVLIYQPPHEFISKSLFAPVRFSFFFFFSCSQPKSICVQPRPFLFFSLSVSSFAVAFPCSAPRLCLSPSRGLLSEITEPFLSSSPPVAVVARCSLLILFAVLHVALVVHFLGGCAAIRSQQIFVFKTCYSAFNTILQIVFVGSVAKVLQATFDAKNSKRQGLIKFKYRCSVRATARSCDKLQASFLCTNNQLLTTWPSLTKLVFPTTSFTL